MDPAIIKEVQKAGFDVYMRDPSDTYMYYTDGKHIAYLQKRRWELSISTVHSPNRKTGTGFQVVKNPSHLDKRTLQGGFAYVPPWVSPSDLETVKKYPDMETFLGATKWNQGFKKVPLVNPLSKE